MARFDTSGLQELINDMRRKGEEGGEVARVMTLAAADEIRSAWRSTAENYGLIDTGAMIASIGYPAQPQKIGDAFAIDVYPQGTDASGTRNAEKAFVLHYGSSRIKPTYWVDEADKISGPMVQTRLERIWSEYLETGRMPSAADIAPVTIGDVKRVRISGLTSQKKNTVTGRGWRQQYRKEYASMLQRIYGKR